MSLPVNPADFFALAKYCLELGERIQNLGDERKHLKARAKMLSLAFGQLHQALLKFKNISKEYHEIFADLRESCYLTLCQIEPTLEEFERLTKGNAVKRSARKLVMAVKNSSNELKQELRDQFVILSLMVLRLNQMYDSVVRRREHAIVVGMIKELKSELARSPIETSKSKRISFKVDAIEQASAELMRRAPTELGAEIQATFEDYISHHEWIEGKVAPTTSSTYHGGSGPAPAPRVYELSESSADEPEQKRKEREPKKEVKRQKEEQGLKERAGRFWRGRKEREKERAKKKESDTTGKARLDTTAGATPSKTNTRRDTSASVAIAVGCFAISLAGVALLFGSKYLGVEWPYFSSIYLTLPTYLPKVPNLGRYLL
ncbi:hypothetical protein B0H67DRAFT_568045 [Lasiosphaeris hirsuta]|uniref:Uncharacterized protein n=1 Tax=Lasiosphaeris hirsuta TaxID=260670 RepID=A0AA40AYR1_9PEZI|nr:hypothetical protein B0H67DRAFT_568045 [Lasiosphaeris hirsuta]